MMRPKHLLLKIYVFVLTGLLLNISLLTAQTPPSYLNGQALRNWLKQNYYEGKHNQLGYTAARRYMYNYIDNKNNSVTGVYSGYSVSWNYGGTGTNPWPINCEHTVPQSFFGKSEPMRSDLHHLFPAYSNWNSVRSNYPFAEINDYYTEKWMYEDESQTSVPYYNIDAYSEYASSKFEPREDHKGNCARAIFYFYTMYPTQAGNISSVGDIDVLYLWHLDDPVDAAERARNNAIEYYQGDRNPYIDHSDLVARAWNLSGGTNPQPGDGELFISEYIEGSSYNKAIEIANFTGETVNLSSYSIKKQTNGSGAWGSELSLSGTLANGNVYVIAHDGCDDELWYSSDYKTTSQAMTFNGNDALGLFKNGNLVDILGVYNSSSYYAKDVTMVRKPSVTSPTINYDEGEWNTYSTNEFDYIGSHSISRGATTYSLKQTQVKNREKTASESKILLSSSLVQNSLEIELIATDKQGETIIKVYDLQGKTVLSKMKIIEAVNYNLHLDISKLANGIYIIKIMNSQFNESMKFVKTSK